MKAYQRKNNAKWRERMKGIWERLKQQGFNPDDPVLGGV